VRPRDPTGKTTTHNIFLPVAIDEKQQLKIRVKSALWKNMKVVRMAIKYD
jgi:hypothetical protein